MKVYLVVFVIVLAWVATETLLPSSGHRPRTAGTSPGDSGTAPDSDSASGRLKFSVEVARQSQFIWPAAGPTNKYFGEGHPAGIDIGLDENADTPILASASGTVAFAGGDRCCDLGLNVILDHHDGMRTRYGHLSKILVSQGQQVEQGDTIAVGGSTGDADEEKQLHFEILRSGVAEDPLRYLAADRYATYARAVNTVTCPSEPIRIYVASRLNLTFLAGSAGDSRLESVRVSLLDTSKYFPIPDTEMRGQLGVLVTIDPAPTASGDLVRFQLDANVRQGESRTSIQCRLELETLATLPNAPTPVYRNPDPAGSTGGQPAPPAPPRTPTPKPAAPTATAIGPAPTRTPGAVGTPTPRAPQGLKTSTPRPPPGGR